MQYGPQEKCKVQDQERLSSDFEKSWDHRHLAYTWVRRLLIQALSSFAKGLFFVERSMNKGPMCSWLITRRTFHATKFVWP